MASTLAPGALFDGKLEILQLAGVGGMGTVYRARNVALDRIVALKVVHSNLGLDADSNRRFRQEVQTASQLVHPNITAIYGFGVCDQQPFAFFEFLEGQTLSECVAATPPLSSDRVFALMIQACAGLQFAHDNGVIHRDLKPSNFMIVQKPITSAISALATTVDLLKILDFGIAKVMREGPEVQRLTATGAVIGTPLYMSPEQCRGESATVQSDIYGLGCVIYSVVYGKPPHSGDTSFELLYAHLQKEPSYDPIPADYPTGIVTVLQKALAKDPKQRYESMSALAADLTRLAQGVSVAPGDFIAEKPKTSAPRKVLVPLMAGSVAVLLVLLGVQFDLFSSTKLQKAPITVWNETHDVAAVTRMYARTSKPDEQEEFEDSVTDGLLRNPNVKGALLLASMKSSARGITAEKRMHRQLSYFMRRVPPSEWTDATFSQCLKALTQTEKDAGNTDPQVQKTIAFANTLHNDGNHVAAVKAFDSAFSLCDLKRDLHDKHLLSLITGMKSQAALGNRSKASQYADFVHRYAVSKSRPEPLREVATRSDRLLDHTQAKKMWQDYVAIASNKDHIPADKTVAALNRLAINEAITGDKHYKNTAQLVWAAATESVTPANARQLLVCGDLLTYVKDPIGAKQFYKAAQDMAVEVLEKEPTSALAGLVNYACIQRNEKINESTKAVMLSTAKNINLYGQKSEPLNETFLITKLTIDSEVQFQKLARSGASLDKSRLNNFREFCIVASLFHHLGDASLTAKYLEMAAAQAYSMRLPQAPKYAIVSGAQYIRARQPSLARKELKKGSQYKPDKDDGHEIRTLLAICSFEEKNYPMAFLGLQLYLADLGPKYEPITITDKQTLAERHFMVGECLVHQGRYSPADNHFREAYELTATHDLQSSAVHKKSALRQIDCQRHLALAHKKLDYNPEVNANNWEQKFRESEDGNPDSRPN